MKRYNQGFLKFGPMEECDTGEWIKAVDADNTMNEIKRQGAKVFSDLSKKIYEENINLALKLTVVTALLIVSIGANLVAISI